MHDGLPLRNIRLLLEYDGTAYLGWQQQDTGATIQGKLLEALDGVLHERPTLSVAGRTDAGVHARGQVVNFTTRHPIEARRLAPGLNRYLPDDISVHLSEEVPLSFDARHSSLSKRYRYRVYSARQPAALERDAWFLPRKLDATAMRRAAAHLIGELDFESFRSSHCDANHATRRMFSIDIAEEPRPPAGVAYNILFHANAYCRHMCRILAGTLVEVGYGERDPDSIPEILAARQRASAGVTAPARGLTLWEIVY